MGGASSRVLIQEQVVIPQAYKIPGTELDLLRQGGAIEGDGGALERLQQNRRPFAITPGLLAEHMAVQGQDVGGV